MHGQHQPPISPLGAIYTSGPPPMHPAESSPARLNQLQTMSMEGLGGYSDYDGRNRSMHPPGQAQQRQRRKQPQGPEHVKHKRTRSGCYTCRQRRVKCDETHPICERCRKGKRECIYPGASSSTKPSPSLGTGKDSAAGDGGSSPSGDESDLEEKPALSAIPDDGEGEEESEPQSSTSDLRKPSDASFAGSSKHITPATIETSSAFQRGTVRAQAACTMTECLVKPSISQSTRWPTLPEDIRAYLKYHRDTLSCHHYGFIYDAGDFLKTTLLEIAMDDDGAPLLYAIAAFAAYHHTLSRDDHRILTFLSYYNTSISYLQQSLKKKQHNVATLLTMLQLATIEESLGDWKILLGHQKAAQQILTDLFTPQTILQDETRRRIISWYIRFDLFATTLAGGQKLLGREWYAAQTEFYSRQAQARPDDLGARFEDFFASSRLLAADVTLMIAAKMRGTVTDEQFMYEVNRLNGQITSFGGMLESAFTDPSYYIKSLPSAPPPSDSDISDFRDPNFLYSGNLFTMNYVLINFWAIKLNFKYQLMLLNRHQPTPELTEIALKKSKMFEALQYCDQLPPGGILGCQASHSLASLFLPRDRKHTLWAKRKFALIEQNGYIYPTKVREFMSQQWGEDVTYWWLPNDEGYPKTVRAIRELIENRSTMQNNEMGAQLWDIGGTPGAMRIGDEPQLPEDFAGTGADSDAFDATLASSISFESNPEQTWTRLH